MHALDTTLLVPIISLLVFSVELVIPLGRGKVPKYIPTYCLHR